MVMETPSPQLVGREFVRQYYTMLNQKPTHLHRFYNEESMFVHGGIDQMDKEGQPAHGQEEIHRRIVQLDFNNCRAKIKQVDSQPTLGNGVVVQVCGELSNNGRPMRRFMQTFVLAPQSPKKYYLHNDIFRYQDEEEDDDQDIQEDSELDEENEDGAPYYQHISRDPEQSQNMNNGTSHHVEPDVSRIPNLIAPENCVNSPPQQPQSQLIGHPPSATMVHQPAFSATTVHQHKVVEVDVHPLVNNDTCKTDELEQQTDVYDDAKEDNSEVEDYEDEEEVKSDDIASPEHGEPMVSSHGVVENTPRTYATMVTKNAPSGYAAAAAGISASINQPVSKPPVALNNSNAGNQDTGSGSYSQPQPQRSSRGGSDRSGKPGEYTRGGSNPPNRERARNSEDSNNQPNSGSTVNAWANNRESVSGDSNNRISSGGGGGSNDWAERRVRPPMNYADNQQLFVGNLPLKATEEELRAAFSKFGKVIEVKINNKAMQPGKPGGPPGMGKAAPNFAFVIFDEASSVQNYLHDQGSPLTLHNNRLNVEEKKPRAADRMGGGRGNGSERIGGRTNSGSGNMLGGSTYAGSDRGPPRRDGGGRDRDYGSSYRGRGGGGAGSRGGGRSAFGGGSGNSFSGGGGGLGGGGSQRRQ